MEIKSVLTERNLYGNIEIYSPNMVFMFYCNQRKLDFYLKKELVKKIGDKKYQLTFVPNGLGYSDRDGLNLGDKPPKRDNRCVVTGQRTNLTKHHIVPSLFRKHLPEKYKYSFVLVVLINAKEHRKYTIEEQKFYNVLADKYGVEKFMAPKIDIDKRPKNIAYALTTYSNAIPEDTQKKLRLEFLELTGLEATEENLIKYKLQKQKKTGDNVFGVELVSKITDFDEFEQIWLNHFIETMNPKFLPEDLILKYNLNLNNDEN
jgi:hypothetical protein